MDSITQGVLGAAAAQAVLKRRLPQAGWIGAIGGMAADLDVFIRSVSDPTVGWVFHRHFTHSLFFIPLGGLIAALPFLLMSRFRNQRRDVILASIIGYATHAPLDMFTSYGTQLFWPFTDLRVALDWVAIVDPVYTIPLWLGVYWTARTRNPKFVRLALLLTTLYIVGFGAWQHHRGVEAQTRMAEARGHRIEHARVMPAPGWLLLWRSTYLADGRLHADGIRTPWLGKTRILPGSSAPATTFAQLPPNAQANAESRRRFEILTWFSDRMLAPIPGDPNAIGDMRITSTVEGMTPLWGLAFDPATGETAAWHPSANLARDYRGLLRSLLLSDERYLPLSALPGPAEP
ncbi:MAG: metal-dependent hydrolase [Blastocatellia bacterium]|nr:metal-dependent hydrolase [Blastocatellia bacterium]